MPKAPDIAVASLVLSSFVLLVATLLGWREWHDRRRRPDDPTPDDADHFVGQDRRRTIGLVVLGLLAAGLVVGSRLPTRVANRANPAFIGVWLGIFALIFLLLALAMRDWIALRRYARRQRKELLRERIEILQEEIRRRKSAGGDGNGHPEGPIGDLFR